MRKNTRKLELNRETVRHLQAAALKDAEGGFFVSEDCKFTVTCPGPSYCESC